MEKATEQIKISISASTRDGLAYHQSYSDPTTWTITHVASGWAIITGIETADDMLRALTDLLESGVDWTQEYAALEADGERIREIVCQIAHDVGVVMQSNRNNDRAHFRFGAAKLVLQDGGRGMLTVAGIGLSLDDESGWSGLNDLVMLLSDERVRRAIATCPRP